MMTVSMEVLVSSKLFL